MGHTTSYSANDTEALDWESMKATMDKLLKERPTLMGMNVIVSPYVPPDTVFFFQPPEPHDLRCRCRLEPVVEDNQYRMRWVAQYEIPAVSPFWSLATDEPVYREPDRTLEMWIGYAILFLVLVAIVLWGMQ